jgi:exonuclease III
MDYLFASRALAERLERCVALPPSEWYVHSDHSPIVATFGS